MYAGNSISRTLNPGFRNQINSDLDELALFPSEQAAVTADDEEEQLPWRAPERATQTFVFERQRVAWRQPVPRRPLKCLELDTAPHRLLNGFIVSIAVGAAVFMGVRGVRAVAEIYPDGGLPRPSAPALLEPAGNLIPSPASVAPVAPIVVTPLGQVPAGASLQTRQLQGPRVAGAPPQTRSAATVQPSANTAAELRRIRAEATERAAREAEALTASFAGAAGSATGLTARSDP
jgi:hypothetical protein